MPLPERDLTLDRLDTGEQKLLVSIMYQAETDMAKAHAVLNDLNPMSINTPGQAWKVLGAAALHDECLRFFTAPLSSLPAICELVGMNVRVIRDCVRPTMVLVPDGKQLGVYAFRWLVKHWQIPVDRNEPAHRAILKAAREQWPHELR